METQLKTTRVASLLFCLQLFVAIGIGELAGNSTLGYAQSASTEGRPRIASVSPCRSPQTSSAPNSVALKNEEPQSPQTCLGCSDLFEEETPSHFNILNSTAPHILYALSGRNNRPSAQMKTADWPTKLYLVNSTLRC